MKPLRSLEKDRAQVHRTRETGTAQARTERLLVPQNRPGTPPRVPGVDRRDPNSRVPLPLLTAAAETGHIDSQLSSHCIQYPASDRPPKHPFRLLSLSLGSGRYRDSEARGSLTTEYRQRREIISLGLSRAPPIGFEL